MKKVIGEAAVTVSEAVLISLLVDTSLSDRNRKLRINGCFENIASYSKLFGCDIQKSLFPALLSTSVGKVIF